MKKRPTLGELVDIELKIEKLISTVNAELNSIHSRVKDLRKMEFLRLKMEQEAKDIKEGE